MKTSKIATLIVLTITASLSLAEPTGNFTSAQPSLELITGQPADKLVAEPSPPATSNSTVRGKLLYENHCRICHTSNVHIREQRKVTSVADILYWVTRWRAHLKLTWSDNDISDVVDYLNSEYYHFKESTITE